VWAELHNKIAMDGEDGAVEIVLAKTSNRVLPVALKRCLELSDHLAQINEFRELLLEEMVGVHVNSDIANGLGALESRRNDIIDGDVQTVPLGGDVDLGSPSGGRSLAPDLVLVFAANTNARFANDDDLKASTTEGSRDEQLVECVA
jgi:hypothetical protein